MARPMSDEQTSVDETSGDKPALAVEEAEKLEVKKEASGESAATPDVESEPAKAAAPAPERAGPIPEQPKKASPEEAKTAPEQAKAPAVVAETKTPPEPVAAPAAEKAKVASEPIKEPEREKEIEFSTSIFRRRATLQSPKQTLQPQSPPPPPPKKKRREGTLSAFSGFLSFILLLLVAGAFGYIAVQHKLKDPGPLSADKVVYFPPRTDLPEMLAHLEREGVIESPALINLTLLLERARDRIRPGEYAFKQHVSAREVMDELIAGRQVLHAVTIPEGLTSEQVLQRLRENGILAGDVADAPKEGALLPETYKVARAFPRSKLIAKMQEDQRKLVDQIWAKRARDLPLRTPFELVTLASIVEKETGKAEERPRVAAVFVNRLRKGMRLQSDPTIVYGLVGGKATLGRGIQRSEIERYTPYNTYAVDGLPPGPIANPGKAALEATANPARTQDLYFVADGTGGHVFAGSLEEHARNVQRWRQIERDQKDKFDADHAAPGAPAPAAPKTDRRGDAGFGRLIGLASGDDFPRGARMAADEGPTHRLGRYPQSEAAFTLGGFEDASRAAARPYAALRPSRPFFTEETSRLAAPAPADPALYALHDPARTEEPVSGDDVMAMAAESADGRALAEPEEGPVASYPVSAKLRAEQKAKAAKLGLSAGSDELPADAIGARPAPPESAPTEVASAASAQRPRPRAFDASEGTALDPLRDRSWDLTTPKTVPPGASFR